MIANDVEVLNGETGIFVCIWDGEVETGVGRWGAGGGGDEAATHAVEVVLSLFFGDD